MSPLLAQGAASEGWEGSSQTILLARRGRTIRMCSLDARSEGQSGCSPRAKLEKSEGPRPGSWHVSAASGWAGENDARSREHPNRLLPEMRCLPTRVGRGRGER